MKRLALSAALAAAVLLFNPPQADAGGCMTCTDGMDCPGGFCVLHNGDVGCGMLTMLCCPGQACGIDAVTGRPSCEGDGTCTVVTAAGSDAGTDSGAPGTDAGAPGTDAAAPTSDADIIGTDAGDTVPRGGCRCQLGAGSGTPPAGGLLLVLALAVAAVRRRRG